MIGRLSDEAIGAAIAPTLRELFDAEPGMWSRLLTAQLIAVVEYGRGRGPDPAAERRAALVAALTQLGDNPLLPDDTTASPEARASLALVAAIGRDDAAADAVRRVLRPVLVAELDGELVETMSMMDGFRGRLRDA